MKPYNEIKRKLAEENPNAILFDGYEKALIGVIKRFNMPVVACYDYEKCISILRKRDKMTDEEAREYFDYNTLGCWAGEHTPTFLYSDKDLDIH